MVERGEHLKLVREVPKCVYSKHPHRTLAVLRSHSIH